MWCKNCRQDVPGIASTEEGIFRCARCGGPAGSDEAKLAPGHMRHVSDAGLEIGDSERTQPRDATSMDDWESDEELARRVRRMQAARGHDRGHLAHEYPSHRFHPPEIGPIQWHPEPGPTVALQSPAAKPPRRKMSLFGSLAIALGTMAFACGVVLLAWSFVDDRGDLWSLGMPITLAGQCALVLGLVLQLERLWQTGADTAGKLDRVDEQLHDLKQTTGMLGNTHSSPAQSFYAHLSSGASPQLLLSDLKGQLDLLATRMSK